jgi:D-serine deaminase-like pyridoxal phosphate-dependent protein
VLRGAPTDTLFAFMGDEHGALVAPAIGERLRPGDPISLVVPHCDPTVNLYDHYHLVRGETLVDIWPVSARGRAR